MPASSDASDALGSLRGVTDPADPTVPSQHEVTRQVERILGHSLFQRSQRLSRFLTFTVESTGEGRAAELKESVIGVEVFGRGSSYNPQEDPIVRIMAGRLRGKLAEYYQSSGQSDPVLIELPKGGYVPRFAWRRPAGQAPPGVVPREPAPFEPGTSSRSVGREGELERLRAAFASVSAGSGFMVAVSGEAGMGKTTLAEDFLAGIEAAAPDTWVGRGQCSERLAETDAFAPILEALQRLLGGESGCDSAQLMRTTAPSWYAQVALSTGEPLEASRKATSETSPERMRREFVSFFEELSRTRPVILFLDDLHWADPSSCDLLAYLGARISRSRLMLLVTYRPAAVLTGAHPFLTFKLDLERRGTCHELPLSFLSPEDVARYIGIQFPVNAFPDEFVRIVHQRTEGNPLFMTDMLRYLRDQGILLERSGVWNFERTVSDVRKIIPVGVRSMIRLKIHQMVEDDRRLLLCAAVQGVQFDSAVVADVLSRDPADVEERLQELDMSHDLVRFTGEQEFPTRAFSAQYRFVHVFYQNALYDSLAPTRRAVLSVEIARSLVKLTGDSSRAIASDLALLFEAGRDYASASEYFLHAARNAARMYAYPEAVTLCERGLNALRTLPDTHKRDAQELRFSIILGMALMVTRGYAAPEVEKTHGRSRELCIRLGDTRRLLSVLWGLHTCDLNSGDLSGALLVAREMLQVAETLPDPIALVEALHALGTTFVFMGRLREGRETLDRIFTGYALDTHVLHASLYVMDPWVSSLSMLARLLVFLGNVDQALAKAEHSIELAKRLAHPASLTYATFWRGYVHHARGENEESRQYLELTMAMSREHGLPQFLEWARVIWGSALARIGRVAEGISEMNRSLDRQNAMRLHLDRPYCLTLLAEALGRQGAKDEALALCDEALELGQRTECRCYEPETHRVRGEVLLSIGEDSLLPEVQAEFAAALQLARQEDCRLLELRAAVSQFRLRRRLGDTLGGRALLAEVVDQFSEGAESPVVVEARSLLSA